MWKTELRHLEKAPTSSKPNGFDDYDFPGSMNVESRECFLRELFAWID